MKKIVLVFLLLVSIFALSACTEAEGATSSDGIIEIGERFFITQMTEIFLNHNRYLGRTIRYEGMFRTASFAGEDFSIVYRNALGCCSPNEVIGFEVIMDDFELFEDNTWVEVTGVLDFDGMFVVVRVTDIIELEERGAELVF